MMTVSINVKRTMLVHITVVNLVRLMKVMMTVRMKVVVI